MANEKRHDETRFFAYEHLNLQMDIVPIYFQLCLPLNKGSQNDGSAQAGLWKKDPTCPLI